MKNDYVIFIRGINVSGKNIVKMKDLKEALQKEGFEDAKTYIQSGNVVLSSDLTSLDDISASISNVLKNGFDVDAPLITLSKDEYSKTIKNNPFSDPQLDPKTVHMVFLAEEPKSDCKDKLDSVKIDSESYEIIEKVLYLHAPDGIGRSKFVANMEKMLGTSVTARNLRTVMAVFDLM